MGDIADWILDTYDFLEEDWWGGVPPESPMRYLTVVMIGHTEKAWLVEWKGGTDWFPKSRCHFTKSGRLACPQWIIDKKEGY